MTHELEANLVLSDSKGEPIAIWRKHPFLRKNILYRLKEMTLKEIELLGVELYTAKNYEGDNKTAS